MVFFPDANLDPSIDSSVEHSRGSRDLIAASARWSLRDCDIGRPSRSGARITIADDSRPPRQLAAQSPRQRRQVQRPEAVMLDPAQVGVEEGRAGPAGRISAWRCGRGPCPRRSPDIRRGRCRNCAARWRAPCRSRESPASPRPRRSGFRRPSARHWMSTSIEGEVNGKKLGRKRIFTSGTSKNALQNSSSTHFRLPILRRLVDHEPLDLMEHRRVGLVEVGAIGAAGADDADRRLLRQHGAHLHGARMRAQQLALARRRRARRRTCRASRAPDGRAGSSAW